MNGKSQKKQILILIVLLALLSISLFSQLLRDNGPVVTSVDRNPRSAYAAKASASEKLDVDLLSEEQPKFSGVKRNIFQFGGGSQSDSPQNVAETDPVPLQTVPQPPPLPEVYYLGFYYEKESDLKMAALSNNGRIMVGKVGQVLGGRFEVLEIASDHVVLKLRAEDSKLLRVPLGKAPSTVIEETPERSQ